MDSIWNANGDTLYVLTYHSQCADAPEFLYFNGLEERSKHYYDMGSAGVVANGVNAGAINFIQTQFFEQNPINNIANFTFSSKVSTDNPDSVDITVSTTALENIPAGVKLHIIVSENLTTWAKLWPAGVNDTGAVENGQTIVTDLALDIIGDTLGNDFPEITSGESFSMTHPFTLNSSKNNKDNLEITAILQVVETKEILAFTRHCESPFNSSNAIKDLWGISKNKNFAIKINNSKVFFNVPFSNTTATLFNSLGQKLAVKKFLNKLGKEDSIGITSSNGVLLLMLKSDSGKTLIKKMVINQ